MSLHEDIRVLMEEDILAKAHTYNQEFLRKHPELHGNVLIQDPAGFADRKVDMGRSALAANVHFKGIKLGEFQFDLSYRPDGTVDGNSSHPLIAVMQHFYKDDRVDVGKGEMSRILDEWLAGIKNLGVKKITVVGGTEFWNKPAQSHPEFEWSGYKVN